MLLEPRGHVNRTGTCVQPMRLAWFRVGASGSDTLVDVDALLRILGSEHDLQVFTESNAHDFVWMDFRDPYHLCVFELDDTARHAFIWPYLLHYGGVLLLRARTLHESRADTLILQGRPHDYIAEFAFSEGRLPYVANRELYRGDAGWTMLRLPIVASRLAVVPHSSFAEALQRKYAEAHIRYAPLPVGTVELESGASPSTPSPGAVTFGVVSTDRVDVARRSCARARDQGSAATLLIDTPERVVRGADVLLTLDWSDSGYSHTVALAAMACGKAVVVPETEPFADWPMLDPQTWRPRPPDLAQPIGVSIDPRDEERSLTLTLQRLAADAALRGWLGERARAWWQAHASIERVAAAWRDVLRDAAGLGRLEPPDNWPAHLQADGTDRAREILEGFGVTVDLFRTRRPDGPRSLP